MASQLGPQPRAISVLTRGGFVSQKLSLPAPHPLPPIFGRLGSWSPQGGPEQRWGQRWVCARGKTAREGGAASKKKSAKKPEPQTETKCVFLVLRGYLEQWK